VFEWAIALTIFCAVSSNEGFRGGSAPRRNESIFGGLKAWRLIAGEKGDGPGVLGGRHPIEIASRNRWTAHVCSRSRNRDEVLSSLQQFVQRENIHAATFTAIGALSAAVLLYVNWEKKEYEISRSANRSRSPR